MDLEFLKELKKYEEDTGADGMGDGTTDDTTDIDIDVDDTKVGEPNEMAKLLEIVGNLSAKIESMENAKTEVKSEPKKVGKLSLDEKIALAVQKGISDGLNETKKTNLIKEIKSIDKDFDSEGLNDVALNKILTLMKKSTSAKSNNFKSNVDAKTKNNGKWGANGNETDMDKFLANRAKTLGEE